MSVRVCCGEFSKVFCWLGISRIEVLVLVGLRAEKEQA